jgi:hypothetical protein
MSSIVTEVALLPPPPPPLELERFQTLSKSGYYGGKRSVFTHNFLTMDRNDLEEMRSRGGNLRPNFSRESSVASTASNGSSNSLASKSSTLSRLFSRKGRSPKWGRSVSIDSVSEQLQPQRNTTWSSPATPTPAREATTYATIRGRARDRFPSTPSLGQRIRQALSQEKRRLGKFLFLVTEHFKILLTKPLKMGVQWS